MEGNFKGSGKIINRSMGRRFPQQNPPAVLLSFRLRAGSQAKFEFFNEENAIRSRFRTIVFPLAS